jgi:hypothetical protein
MTVEPFTKNGGLVIFVTVGDRHQPRVRGESVVFGGGLHDPLLNSLVFPNWRNIPWVLKKSVIGMYSWLRLSLPSRFSSHLS